MATVTVRINGIEYNLKGKEDEAYLQHLAAHVEEKLQEILKKNTKLSVSAASVLTAINLADEAFKSKNNLSELLESHEILKKANKSTEQELKQIKSNIQNNVDKKEIEYKNILQKKDIECKNILQKKNIECKNIISELEEKMKSIIKEKNAVLESFNSLKEKNSLLINEKERLENEIIELQEELNEEIGNNLNTNVQAEMEELKEKLELLQNEKDELKGKNIILKQSNKELKFNLQSSKYRVIDLENKFLESQITIATEKVKNSSIAIKKQK